MMKKTNILLFTLLAALLSGYVNAQGLTYKVSLLTTSVEDGSAFGGTTVNDLFYGSFTVDPQELGDTVKDFGDTTIADPTMLAYSFAIGDHAYSYAYDPDRNYLADPDFGLGSTTFEVAGNDLGNHFEVTDIISFMFKQPGDADSYELYINSEADTWSAYDNSSGNLISGTSSIAAVPVPPVIWMLGFAFIGLTRIRKNTERFYLDKRF